MPQQIAQPPERFRLMNSEAIIASAVVLILFVMVVPLPSFLLDMLLTTNIAISLAILLTAFYATRPLEFAIFPGLLLMTTLFRLSLNVASTRLILSEAKAGALIQAFGQFVVSGNYVVGSIIFLVLVIINFVVITKGSGRIAEVAARFTLDALPGKQMAIDADLNAGLIDEQEARQRREEIGREADFYGAMDGASKFVRGDAIAGLIITAINIVGGLIIGVAQLGMSFAEAASTFSLLSIGDGLVSQIPALLISTAAGIIVSRASNEANLAQDFKGQLFRKPHPIFITGAFLLLLGLVPGLPLFPFWLLAGVTVLVGRARLQEQQQEAAEKAREAAREPEEEPRQEEPSDLLLVDPLELEIGYALIPIVDPNQKGDLLERVRLLRQQLALELGIVVPPIRIRDNVALPANHYVIKLRGNPIAEGEILPGYYLALLGETVTNPPPGIRVNDPTFGLPAIWVAERNLPEAERQGLTVVEAPAVVTTHLLEVLRKHAYQLLDRQEVQKLVDKVREKAPALVDELVPNLLSLGAIQKVLKRLLQERIPVRDLVTILEALADHAPSTKNIDVLTEYVRAALAPTITRQFSADDGKLHVFVLDPVLEQHLLDKARSGELNPSTLGLEPQRAERIIQEADRLAKKLIGNGWPPVLLTSPVLRMTLFNFLSPMVPDIAVLSYNDLVPDAQVEVIDQLKLT
ncbi:MAG: flagellar biosynthesis protein FlhA [Rhodothermaceae bacterium]|nr:MAG: flagellar biosynthesis protein FlhA [Rhodothermaceae bacterium]